MAKIQSVEPNIADLANGWLKSYKRDYKLEQESLNTEIDQALNDYYSKNGGVGGNRPDAKLLLQDKNLVNYPILIEYKGYKDKLVKLDADGKVANKTAKNQPDFRNINSYAVNGAVHYANALLHYTSYTDIIAIGMTGYKNDAGKLEYEIGVYYVSKSNFGVGQKVDDFTDLSFLKKSNFDAFIEKVKQLQLSQEEIEKLREHREQEINASLVKLNNDIYNNEKGLSERDRVYLVAASIIATLGVPGKVAALEKSELKSSTEEGNRDGDIILRKIKAFLGEKNLPQEKRDLIVRTLQNTLTTDNINKVEDGESQLKRVFTKIIDDLGIYYKIGLSTDFTGTEEENGEQKSTNKSISGNLEGDAGGKLLKVFNAELKLDIRGGIGTEKEVHSASREIITKTLHDAAFDIAYDSITPVCLTSNGQDQDDYGAYVELTRVFDVVDFDYLERIFSKGGLIEYLKKTEKEKIETTASVATESLNRSQQRSNSNAIRAKIKEAVAASGKQYDGIKEIIDMVRQIIPYNRMLISSDGYLIPLDDRYFRIDAQNLGFKYGGEITCVGMITNIIGEDTDPNDSQNIFATLQFSVNEVLRQLLPTKERNLCVIHPIAVYYGN